MKSENQKLDLNWAVLFSCWMTASISTLAALFFSEVVEYPPCALCWYQRIFMFPLVIILLAGLFPVDTAAVKFALPLACIGWLIALYHNLLYSGIIDESLQPCRQGISCTDINLNLLGFITIPLLSLLAFTIIAGLLIFLKWRTSK
jgi:disulfide bond formation protein DsbB